MGYDNWKGYDTQDAIIVGDEAERRYSMRHGDEEAHPMLMHGLGRKSGRLEGTHSIIDSLDELGNDHEDIQ